MKDQPYSSYKNSNIWWLGNIPIHWKIQRLKYAVKLINENVDEFKTELPYIGLKHIEKWTGKLLTQEIENNDGQSKIFRTGDVLFGKLRPYLAKVIRTTFKGQCTGELLVLRPKNITQDYLFYYLLSREFIEIVNSSTYGAKMPRASWDSIGNLPILLLPEAEQQIITEFLDCKIQKIDSVIRRKKQQIELLQEKSTAFTEHIITKGLDPKVRMKNSEINWLGIIPKHWKVIRSKGVFIEKDDRSITGEEELLTVSHITGVTPRSEKNVGMFMADSLVDYKKCNTGDLVINTMWAWMGALGIAFQNGVVSPSYNVYRFRKPDCDPRYYDMLFRTRRFISEINRFSKGVWTSRLRLYPNEFFQIRIPCPPFNEQRSIAEFIDQEIGLMNKFGIIIQSSIEKLREYRIALISAAVTGKIDVRKEVA